jgi:murein DD-endopeptidase
MNAVSEMSLFIRSGSARRSRLRWIFAVVVVVVVVAAAACAAWWYLTPRRAAEPKAVVTPVAPSAVPPAAAPAESPGTAVPPPRLADGTRFVRAIISGPLETAFVAQVGRELGAPLTQVVVRNLIWWVSVPEDFRPGDVVDVLFTERQGAEPLVHAVRLQSAKAGRTFEAYRFQPAGSPFAHFYGRDGNELELRLVDAPLDDHEQVTSLIRDGRGHKGVDFRVPAGTPVKATFDAVVARRTWSFAMNGNCLDLREEGGAGRSVYLLHLSELPPDLHVGDHVKKGTVVARSGNSGHSFAPHLHYQLMSAAGRVLDPFAAQATTRRALTAAQRAAFDVEVGRLDGLLASFAAAAPKAPQR